jgi:hypothetical protein
MLAKQLEPGHVDRHTSPFHARHGRHVSSPQESARQINLRSHDMEQPRERTDVALAIVENCVPLIVRPAISQDQVAHFLLFECADAVEPKIRERSFSKAVGSDTS